MIPILSSSEAFDLDKETIDSGYASKSELMDRAGLLSAQFIIENIEDPFNSKFAILAGPGDNGGDGIICHYYLKLYKIDSILILLEKNIENSWIFNKYPISRENVLFFSNTYNFSDDFWYIDCIFGIGFNRPCTGKYKTMLQKLDKISKIISLDIPSGIYCDSGLADEFYVNSKITLSMGHCKIGHYFNAGLEASGKLHILDIGLQPIKNPIKYIQCIEYADANFQTLKWKNNIHKYSRGRVCSIAGSLKFTGAGILAIKAAMMTGAGILKAFVPINIRDLYDMSLPEAIILPIVYDDIKPIDDEIDCSDVVLFGPGLCQDRNSIQWMSKILKLINKPLILDASGFLPISEKLIQIDDLPINTILTPHYAEFANIFDISIDSVYKNPISIVKSIIPNLQGRILILKGPTTIIVTSKGDMLLMTHGNSILATAGSGDVLAGILSSLISQGMDYDQSAICGTYFHAECGVRYENKIGKRGMLASDMVNMIPYAMQK